MSKTDATKIENVAATAVDAVLAAKQGAKNLGQTMSTRLDEMKSQSADGLHSGADWVRTASESVAGKLDTASSYIGGCNALSLAGDLRRAVKRHPVGFLVMAAAFGFCAGTAMTRLRTAAPKFKKEELV